MVFDRALPGTVRELTDADLYDASAAEEDAPRPGWYLRLDSHGAGEKVAARRSLSTMRCFTTYQPLPE